MNLTLVIFFLTGCALPPAASPSPVPGLPSPIFSPSPAPSPTSSPSPVPSPTPVPPLSNFDRIVVIVLSGQSFESVVGNPDMPSINRLAHQYTLLRRYYAVTHPWGASLTALLTGDSAGVLAGPNLLDLVEQSGRTWTAYLDDSTCVEGYDPFASIAGVDCPSRIASLDSFEADLTAGALPNLSFVRPGPCSEAAEVCELGAYDAWLGGLVDTLRNQPGLLTVVTFDAAAPDDEAICCGLDGPGGGRVPTLLISPYTRQAFIDDTPYTHYSLLKTIAGAWALPLLGHAADAETALIAAPFEPPLEAVILTGAGDITVCGEPGDVATAALLETIPGEFFTAGDNVNQVEVTMAQYQGCFEPTWGQFKDRLHPSPGNHDYEINNGEDYYTYFGDSAGPAGKGWYSWDYGDWHLISLNGNCDLVGCGEDSEQLEWLRADLAAHPNLCTLAYWHQPRFSSGLRGSDSRLADIWRELYQARVDVVINGHDHIYERFTPQSPDGNADPLAGIRQFTVGTGGAFYTWPSGDPIANSERIILDTFGVLKLSLRSDRYEWEFIPEPGKPETDSGSAMCH